MATDLESMTIAAQDQVLAAISTTQAAVLDGVRTLTSTISSSVPGAMKNMPSLPGIDAMPSPTKALEMSFDFASRLLASQRDFTLALVGATMPAAAPTKAAKAKA